MPVILHYIHKYLSRFINRYFDLLLIFIMIIVSTIVISYNTNHLKYNGLILNESTLLTIIFTIMAFTLGISPFAVMRTRRDALKSIKHKLKEIEEKTSNSPKTETVMQMLTRHINIAIDNEELTMLRSEGRANTLYVMGQIFLTASVLGPIISIFVYCYTEPLSANTVSQLKELHNVIGVIPDQTTLAVERDWRILLGGVTFGFLLLAAATGMLKQQAREIAVYFRVSERVNYYKRMISVLDIANETYPENVSSSDKSLAEIAMASLLHSSGRSIEDDTAKGDGDSVNILDLLKMIKSAN